MKSSKIRKGKFRKFTPHKSLNEGWRYYKFEGSDQIIAMRVNIVKAFFVVEEGGQPVLDTEKQPVHECDLGNEIKLLSLEEYEEIKKSALED